MTPKQYTAISFFLSTLGIALMFAAAFYPADAILYACCGLMTVVGGWLVKIIAGDSK